MSREDLERLLDVKSLHRFDEIVQKQYEVVAAYQEIALKTKDKEAAHALAAVIDKVATLAMIQPARA